MVTVTFEHRGKPVTLRLVELCEDISTTDFSSSYLPDSRSRLRRFWDWMTGTQPPRTRGQFSESIVGIMRCEGQIIGNLPDDWRPRDDYRFDSPEFSGRVIVRSGYHGAFVCNGPYRCPALEAERAQAVTS